MVVFCCSVCGDSLKKNQVNKHYSQCRMNMVSCMDCSQEFWNDDYQEHIKCISEEEKYSGKDYKPRPGQNKGEVKQDAWLQQVQKAIDSSKPSPKMRSLLERLKDYPNIPRKQAKFLNFLKNSMRISDPKLVSSVWEILMSGTQPKDKADGKENDNHENGNNGEAIKGQPEKNGEAEEEEEEEEDSTKKVKKMSKREKKEERRKEHNKQEKKDSKKQKHSSEKVDDDAEEASDRPAKKKGKKRKRNDDYSEGEEEENNDVCGKKNGQGAKKKKSHKMRRKLEGDASDEGMPPLEANPNHVCSEETEEEEDSPPKKKKNKNFNWEQIIFDLLKKAKENSMSEKRLRKKVLAEYTFQGGHVDSMSILKAKFDRKIKKDPRLMRQKDTVRLRDQ